MSRCGARVPPHSPCASKLEKTNQRAALARPFGDTSSREAQHGGVCYIRFAFCSSRKRASSAARILNVAKRTHSGVVSGLNLLQSRFDDWSNTVQQRFNSIHKLEE